MDLSYNPSILVVTINTHRIRLGASHDLRSFPNAVAFRLHVEHIVYGFVRRFLSDNNWVQAVREVIFGNIKLQIVESSATITHHQQQHSRLDLRARVFWCGAHQPWIELVNGDWAQVVQYATMILAFPDVGVDQFAIDGPGPLPPQQP
ncbi:hypothetical protein ACH5RR_028311 [Cinchona calisaya]|uniref:Uncharacterized protein n=1 Tax=Cinchona calisaya TaxID=153742 RepID=A0ABD2YNE4_9GENT